MFPGLRAPRISLQILQTRAVIVSNVVVMKYHVSRTCEESMSYGSFHFATEDFFPHEFALIFTKVTPREIKKIFNERLISSHESRSSRHESRLDKERGRELIVRAVDLRASTLPIGDS